MLKLKMAQPTMMTGHLSDEDEDIELNMTCNDLVYCLRAALPAHHHSGAPGFSLSAHKNNMS
jgi:hypothetical protein